METSQFISVISGVLQGSVLGPLLFILYTANICNNIEHKIISYTNDKTLYAEVVSPSNSKNVANSLNLDLVNIQLWCSTWGMKLNLRKKHSITISQSRTPHLPLALCGLDLEVSGSLELFEVTLENK